MIDGTVSIVAAWYVYHLGKLYEEVAWEFLGGIDSFNFMFGSAVSVPDEDPSTPYSGTLRVAHEAFLPPWDGKLSSRISRMNHPSRAMRTYRREKD